VRDWLIFRRPGLLVFCAALLARLAYLGVSVYSPLLYAPSPDEAYYIGFAQSLLAGTVDPASQGFMDPLIAYLLASVFWLGGEMLSVRLLLVTVDAANAWLLYRLLLGLWGPGPALIAGLGYAFYSAALLYSIFVTKAAPAIFLLLLSCQFLFMARRRGQLAWLAGTGACCALLVPLRGNYLLLLLLMIPAVYLYFRSRPLPALGWFGGAVAVTLLLFTGFHSAATGNSQLLPNNSGVVLYISNHPDNPHGTHLMPDFVRSGEPLVIRESFRREAERRSGQSLNASEVSAYWLQETLSLWRQQPQQLAYRLFQRTRQWLNNYEFGVNYWLEYIHSSVLHGLPLLPFALVLSLGVSGLYLASVTTPLARLFWLPVIVASATGILFFVMSRLRLPMVPFLLAGVGYWWIAARIDLGVHKRIALLIAALLLVVSLWPSSVRTGGFPARLNLVSNFADAGMFPEAEQLARELLTERPASSQAWFLVGYALMGQRQCEQASAAFAQALALDPGYEDARHNLQLCEAQDALE
jgi:tetratricopeptide (TPR) repeat protein